ncbi:MAG: hypothetical protein ACI3YT_06925 [Prevotella sp.]
MRQVANDIVDTLVKKLPIVIGNIDLKKADNKTYNAVRITKNILKRLNKINNQE